MDCSTSGFPVLHQLLQLAQTHVHRVSDATQPSHPLSITSLAFNLSQHQGLFQWVSFSHQVTKVLELQLPVNIYDWFSLGLTGLISCCPRDSRLLQHHSSEALVLQCLAFFMVQFSHPYMTTGETIALTIQIFIGKVMSLHFNMLSRFVIVCLFVCFPKEQESFNFMAAVAPQVFSYLWHLSDSSLPQPRKLDIFSFHPENCVHTMLSPSNCLYALL